METGNPLTFSRVEDAKSHAAYFCRLSGKQNDMYDLLLVNEKQAYVGSGEDAYDLSMNAGKPLRIHPKQSWAWSGPVT